MAKLFLALISIAVYGPAPISAETGVMYWRGRQMFYTVAPDGSKVAEGDIVLDEPKNVGKGRGALAIVDHRWPNGIIPYVIAPSVPGDEVAAAIAEWTSKTPIRFVPRTTQADYVEFVLPAPACNAMVGRVGGRQHVSVCGTNTIHEIGHAVGLSHEHQRPDRDSYINVDLKMIEPLNRWFIYSQLIDHVEVTPYDYGSTMHYCEGCPSAAFPWPVLTTIPVGINLGNDLALSASDVEGVRRMYGFPSTGITIETNPAGLKFTADGQVYTAPATFPWAAGSSHTIGVASVQDTSNLARVRFLRWTDDIGVGSTRTIVATASTTVYTANFAYQSQVSIQQPGSEEGTLLLTPASADGYYPSNGYVEVVATSAPGKHFVRWDSYPTSQNPLKAIAGSLYYPVRAIFSSQAPSTVTTDPPGLPLTIDQNVCFSPCRFDWAPGTQHTISTVTNPVPYDYWRIGLPPHSQIRRDLQSWSDGGQATHSILVTAHGQTWTAKFATKYKLTIDSDTSAPAITVTPPSSDMFYPAGTAVQLTAEDTTWLFSYWSGDFASTNRTLSVAMTDFQYVRAVYIDSCSETPAINTYDLPAEGGTGTVQVTGSKQCWWQSRSDLPWAAVTSPYYTLNSGVVSFKATPNRSGKARQGYIIVAGRAFLLTQSAAGGGNGSGGGGTSPAAPNIGTFSPAAGSGHSQTFTASYSDANGANDIAFAYFMAVAGPVSETNSCYIQYTRATNTFRLMNKAGNVWSSPLPGQLGSTGNGNCALSEAGLQASTVGNTLSLTLPLSFSQSFKGDLKVYGRVIDTANLNTGWQLAGTWTVPDRVDLGSLSPVTGSGISNTFTAVFHNPGGQSKHYLGYILFLPLPNVVGFNAQGTCLIEFNRLGGAFDGKGGMRLINNAGTNWLGRLVGEPLAPGTPPLSNTACTVNVAGASVSFDGPAMSVTVPVSFNGSSVTPVMGTFIQSNDVNGAWTDFRQFGNWRVEEGLAKPGPFVTSATPVTGVGSTANLVVTSGHTSGTGNLGQVHVRVNNGIIGGAPCHLVYFPGNNTVALVNDGESGIVGPVALGAALATDRCGLSPGGNRVISGTSLVLTLPLTFNSAHMGAGLKNVYVNAFDLSGAVSHWINTGLWQLP